MKCSKCNADLAPGEVFCGECGQPVQMGTAAGRTCPRCSDQVEAGERFCGSCGYDFAVATASAPTSARGSAVSKPQVTPRASTTSSCIALVVGLITLAVILLLVAGGLWLWLGSKKQASGNPQKITASITGVWNCEYLPEASEASRALMNLTQNGSIVTGMMTSDEGPTAITGTFNGQVFTITSPRILAPLTLSADGRTMNGQVTDGGVTAKVVCSR
jgi:hypothetical protein